MPFSLEDQLRLFGPHLFEELCGQLVKRDFPGCRHVEGAGGDKGLDIFDGDIDSSARKKVGSTLRVWQVKFFRDGVKRKQREQAEKSLKRVLMHQPDFWTLCVPVNLSTDAHEWFQSLHAQHPSITFDLWQADEIVRRMREDDSLLDTYFLHPQPAIPENTLATILRRLDDFASAVDLLKRARRSLEVTPRSATDFYNGTVPDWRDIVQSFDAPRERFGELWQFVVSRANQPAGRVPFALVIGRSGDGKSAVLMRLAVELVEQGRNLVFYHKDDAFSLRAEQLCDLPAANVAFVFIDKITRFDADTLRGFFERLYRKSIPVVVIGAAVQSIWEGLNFDLTNVADVCEIGLDKMTDEDIDALLDKLSADPARADEYLGELARLSREEQIALFRRKADRQLLVALLEAKRNESFEAYIRGELEQLEDRFGTMVRRTCTLVSALHRFDLPMPRNLLQRLLPNTHLDDEVFRRTHGLLTEVLPKGTNIVTRHAFVAEVMFAGNVHPRRRYEEIINAAEAEEERLIGRMLHLLGLGDRVLAGELLTTASQRFPNNVVFLHMQALLSRQEGDVDKARRLFRRASEINPNDSPTWQAWGLLEKQQGNIGNQVSPDTALKKLVHVINGIIPRIFTLTGLKYAPAFRKWYKAFTARWLFCKATEANPANAHAWQAWALLEAEQGNVGTTTEDYTARWLFKQGIIHCPDHPPVWRAWAILEKEQGNIGESIDEKFTARWLYLHLTKVDPKHAPSWRGWAILESEQGNIGQSKDEELTARWLFWKGTTADPRDAATWQAWGMLEAEQGSIGGQNNPEPYTARWLFRKAVEADPRNVVNWVGWADMEKRAGNWTDAERLYLSAAEVAIDPITRARIYFDLGFMFSLLHQDDKVVKYLKSAVAANPNDHVAHAKLARSYGFLNLWDAADRHYRRALELNPSDRRTQKWYQNMQSARREHESMSES